MFSFLNNYFDYPLSKIYCVLFQKIQKEEQQIILELGFYEVGYRGSAYGIWFATSKHFNVPQASLRRRAHNGILQPF